jgi:anti-anti-sigma factor
MIVHKDFGPIKLVEIQGQFTVEEAFVLRQTCSSLYRGSKLVFNLEEASFVGSSGYIPLLRDLSHLGRQSGQEVSLVGLKPEIKKIIEAFGFKGFKTFRSVQQALTSCMSP